MQSKALFIPIAINIFIFERVKTAEIADRKLIRIELIRINLRSLAVDDLSGLSRGSNMKIFIAIGITAEFWQLMS